MTALLFAPQPLACACGCVQRQIRSAANPAQAGRYELRLNIVLSAVTLKFGRDRRQGELEVFLTRRDEDRAQVARLDQTPGLQLKKETYEAMLQSGFPYRHSFAPKATAISLRVVVRDLGSGAVGALTLPMSNPPTDPFKPGTAYFVSLTLSTRSARTSFSTWTVPDGQRISTESALSAAPSPKCTGP